PIGIGQCKQFFFDVLYQLLMTSSGQVGASDAVAEEHVSTDDALLCMGNKNEVIRGVSGNKKAFELNLSPLQYIVFGDELVRISTGAWWQSVHAADIGQHS